MYCTKCGAQNDDTAKFCTGCGAVIGSVPGTNNNHFNAKLEKKRQIKTKGTAIALVVLFGWFGLIYTWKKDFLVFIIGMAGIIFGFFSVNDSTWDALLTGVSWAIPIVMNVARPQSFFENY